VTSERRHTEHGRERKQQLIDAAVVLFTERGYAATRIADICDAAGVAKGLFYWYFPTKRELFVELVRTMRRRLRQAQAAAMDPTSDPIERIRDGAVASIHFIAAHTSYFALVDVERGDPELAETLREGSDVYLRDVVELVRQAQAEQRIPDTDPVLLAVGVVGAVASFGQAWRNGQITVAPDELAEFVGDWVTRALGATAPVG
jgi:AcrR family transcriptional regulator